MCLIVYVILELVEVVKGGGEDYIVLSYDMVALGVFTSIYSAIQARNGLQQSLSVLNVYEQMDGPRGTIPGLLAMLDIFVNIVMPIVVVFAGFLVVAVQDNYIEGVLNCAALLCKLKLWCSRAHNVSVSHLGRSLYPPSSLATRRLLMNSYS